MLIFTPQITSRISYTFRVIFERILNASVTFTTNTDVFLGTKGTKMAYSPQKIDAPIWIEATSLLFEENVVKQSIDEEKWGDTTLFFPTKCGCFPVDIFAVIFFLISRYEEYYKDIIPDRHGRFLCQNSVAYQLGWHRKLMVHRLALALAQLVKIHYPQFEYALPKYEELSTHDVDIAYQYKGKQWWRWCGAATKALLQGHFTHFHNFLKTAMGIEVADPFDNFETEHKTKNSIYFIPVARFTKYDKNISTKGKIFRDLINKLKENSKIGLHPSYYTSVKTSLIEKEKKRLEKISHLSITKSRQHFLRFRFPDTFQALIKAGITDDYSLGWTNEAGFRASIAVPFPFFDLQRNSETSLILHPLVLMDSIFTKDKEELVLEQLREEVKEMGGVLIMLAHNSNIETGQ